MIEFNDSFSQAAVAEALCAHPGLTKLITHQLMLPSFAYAHDVEGRRIGGPLVQPKEKPSRADCAYMAIDRLVANYGSLHLLDRLNAKPVINTP